MRVALNLAFALQHLHDGGCVQSPHFPKEAGPLQQFHVVLGVKPVLAGGALGTGQAQALPGTDDRGGNSHQAGYVSDFQVRFTVRGFHDPEPIPKPDFL